jgi:hypothetical protein
VRVFCIRRWRSLAALRSQDHTRFVISLRDRYGKKTRAGIECEAAHEHPELENLKAMETKVAVKSVKREDCFWANRFFSRLRQQPAHAADQPFEYAVATLSVHAVHRLEDC